MPFSWSHSGAATFSSMKSSSYKIQDGKFWLHLFQVHLSADFVPSNLAERNLRRAYLHPLPSPTFTLPPSPRVDDLVVEVRIVWPPAKLMACASCVGYENWRIARTPRTGEHRDVAAGDLPNPCDEFAHRPAAAGAEVER